MEDRDACIARFHEDLRRARPLHAVRGVLGGLVDELLAHRLRQIDQTAAIGRVVVQARPARAFRADAAVHRALPAEELLGGVVGALEQRRLAAAFAGLVVQADEHESGEAAHAEGHLRILEERHAVVADHVGAAAEVAFGARGDVAAVDFRLRALLDFLRHADGTQAVHVRFGGVVGLVALAVAEVVEMVAGLADAAEAHLADDGRVEVAHRVVQDGRDGRGVHQVRHRCLAARVVALFRLGVAIERRLHQFLRDGVLHDDVAVAVERPLLFQSERGQGSLPRFSRNSATFIEAITALALSPRLAEHANPSRCLGWRHER